MQQIFLTYVQEHYLNQTMKVQNAPKMTKNNTKFNLKMPLFKEAILWNSTVHISDARCLP